MRPILLLLAGLTLSAASQAQDSLHIYLELKSTPLPIVSTPFREIQVLDNRVDTSRLGNIENGKYPIAYSTFRQPAAIMIRDYLSRQIAPLEKGEKSLLLNIEELRVTNKSWILRERPGRPGATKMYFDRSVVRFYGQAYYRTGEGTYRKIIDIHYDYYPGEGAKIDIAKADLSPMLNRILEAAGNIGGTSFPPSALPGKKNRELLRNMNASITYVRDTGDLPLSSIDRNTKQKWQDYPAVAVRSLSNGIYHNFDDFRAARLDPQPVKMLFDSTDSLYVLSPGPWNLYWNKPWAIADGGNLYLNLVKDRYIMLVREKNTFYFHIPRGVPDMYALLSAEQNTTYGADDDSYPGGGYVGNAAVYGTLFFAGIIADGVRKHSANKKMYREGMQHDFRTCYIDMDCGDIIY